MRTATVLFCTIHLLRAGAPPAAGDSLETAYAHLDRAAASFKSMSANVRRVSHTAVINEDNVDSGRMLLKRSKPRDMRILVELTEPDPKSFAMQGRKAELYYPKIQTVQEYDVGKKRDLLDQFFLLGFGTTSKELEASYKVRWLGPETVAGQKAIRLELVPKSKEILEQLKKFELWVSEATGYPVQQKFYLAAGDYMLVTYTNLKVNPEISDADLKLKLPKGVKREFPQK